MQHCCNGESDEAEAHYGEEELEVAHAVRHPSAHHAGYHYSAQILERSTEREDRCASLTMGEADEKERIGGEAKPIADLFYKYAGGDERQALRPVQAQVHIDDVW